MGVLGLDVGSTGVKLVCLDERGRLLLNQQRPHGTDSCPDHVVDGVAELMLSSTAADLPLLLGACAVSGRVAADGMVTAPGLVDFESIPMAQMLCERLLLPIKVQSASVHAVWGEREAGAAKGELDFLLLDLGPTLGLAAVLGGNLQAPAGEEQFPLGTLHDAELVRAARAATVTGLVDRFRQATSEELSGLAIADRARAGDPAALAAVQGCGEALALAIELARRRAPISLAIVTGGTAALGQALLKSTSAALAQRGAEAARVRLAIGALHPFSAAYGAALEAQSFARQMPAAPD